MAINKGEALVSVADVVIFNASTGAYMGEGRALTNSSLVQEVQSIEHRGGYLNELLFNIKHSKNVNVDLESATFKMEYLAFQTGTPISTGMDSVLKMDDCVTFTNGVGETSLTPVGNVYVQLPNGTVGTYTPTGSSINTGISSLNGQFQVMYYHNATVNKITIDTNSQPLTVKIVMKVRAFSQAKFIGNYEITVPYLKFNGSINFNFAADAVSTFGLGGTAQAYTDDCGNSYYAQVKFIPADDADIAQVNVLAASPNVISLSLAGTTSATVQMIGVRPDPYTNIIVPNSDVTFVSSTPATATVSTGGVITAVAEGTTVVTATYQGLQETINVTVTE